MTPDAAMVPLQKSVDSVATALVVPVTGLDPRSGTGQRTAILFEALRKLGDVAVIILAETEFRGAEVFFPGARTVVTLPTVALASKVPPKPVRVFNAVKRLLIPSRTYASEPGLSSAILCVLGHSHPDIDDRIALVAFRYAQTFAFSGLQQDPAARLIVCVDVDDRDDYRIDQQIRLRLGNLWSGIVSFLWRDRFQRSLEALLSRSSIVFFAKEQDRMPNLSAKQVVVQNVPFGSHGSTEAADVQSAPESLLFVGVASHRPNLAGVTWFLRACWPAIRAARPAARFRIVGLGDWSALPADLAAQPGVEVVGGVDDLAPEYGQARAAICPILEGAGSQIKVIEACAYGRPVVSTAFASGGFGPEIERALSVASDPAGFAQACIDLLADPARAARQGATLRALQQATHSREAVENLIVTTLTDLVASVGPDRKVLS